MVEDKTKSAMVNLYQNAMPEAVLHQQWTKTLCRLGEKSEYFRTKANPISSLTSANRDFWQHKAMLERLKLQKDVQRKYRQ